MTVPGRHRSEEERAELRRRLANPQGGETARQIAQALGFSPTTVYRERQLMLTEAWAAKTDSAPDPPQPAEVHDAEFWRRRARASEREVNQLSAVNRELAALDGLRLRADDFAPPGGTTSNGSATLIVHNSDRHLGEVVEPSEINGWNLYNPDVCRRRVRRFIAVATEIGKRWLQDTRCDGVLYTMAGDEISGDIHEELSRTNAAESPECVTAAAELHLECIRHLADVFGRVHVPAVAGNHGRLTRKPTAKKIGALSYDILIARLVARECEHDERISFDIAAGADTVTMLYGRPILTTHGDNIGTKGGMGFAGPVLPMIRGAHKIRMQYGSIEGAPALILMGHYHTSAAPPGILANGSVVGTSEYGFGLRGHVDAPRQWLAVYRSKWGLAERLDVQLEEPPRPRVRVPALGTP